MENSNHSNVLIIGGGCAGISVASRLNSLKSSLKISIIEPSDNALYQAAWTLVGAGAYNKSNTIKPMSEVMPKYVNWIKSYAETFSPEQNLLTFTIVFSASSAINSFTSSVLGYKAE